METKTCSNCKECKSTELFNKQKSMCRECQRMYRALWYKKNCESEKAKARAYARKNPEKRKRNWEKWYSNNKEKKQEYNKQWRNDNPKYKAEYRETNRDYINERENKRRREKYATDIQYNIKCKLRSRLRAALKGKSKASSTMKLMGCSLSFIEKYLENQFTNEMSWDNMGDYWHIDHIIPFAAFDLSIHTNQHIVCWYKNLQPLHGPENNEKSDKYEEEDKQDLIRRYNEENLSSI
ncbi:hypothetical protein N9A45_01615 [bacterium]|nr:hypothetical protein [bacterium]